MAATKPKQHLMFPFIRHTIASVRLAVMRSLQIFIASSLNTDWMNGELLSLLFQNLVLEEREDIREVSLAAFSAALTFVDPTEKVANWYNIVMTPIGTPLNPSFFVTTGRKALHNVDKHMMASDMSLLSMDTVLQTRLTAAKGLALVQRDKLVNVSFIPRFGLISDGSIGCLPAICQRTSDLLSIGHHSRMGEGYRYNSTLFDFHFGLVHRRTSSFNIPRNVDHPHANIHRVPGSSHSILNRG